MEFIRVSVSQKKKTFSISHHNTCSTLFNKAWQYLTALGRFNVHNTSGRAACSLAVHVANKDFGQESGNK